jgi:hypothetical protein
MKRTLLILTAAWIGLGGGAAGQTAVAPTRIDSRDTLLAALGKATLDCLGTVDPSYDSPRNPSTCPNWRNDESGMASSDT